MDVEFGAICRNRRDVMKWIGVAPLAAWATSAMAQTCVDPARLPTDQQSVRAALGYVLHTPDPAKRCIKCAFFTAVSPTCGKCQMLSGGAVFPDSVCESFAPRG